MTALDESDKSSNNEESEGLDSLPLLVTSFISDSTTSEEDTDFGQEHENDLYSESTCEEDDAHLNLKDDALLSSQNVMVIQDFLVKLGYIQVDCHSVPCHGEDSILKQEAASSFEEVPSVEE